MLKINRLKASLFWLAAIVGFEMDVMPAELMAANQAWNWQLPLWSLLLVFWLSLNVYVLIWIFCLEDGLKIKWLLNFELKIKITLQ